VATKAGEDIGRFRAREGRGETIRALLIAGPTASGKSAAALQLAERFGAEIVNADSMQVYRDLRVLTARPDAQEASRAPHRLFGEIDGAINFSVARWLEAATARLDQVERLLIFVGGTGLYFRALTEGLSDIPHVPDSLRESLRASAEGVETADLHARLAREDPEMSACLRPSDRQRILRALEVMAATGKSLRTFQGARGSTPLKAGEWRGLFLAPDRAWLNARISARFALMLRQGALDEVAALARRGLDPALPVMRAHGVPHLVAHLGGRMTLAEAEALSLRDTRQYSKRQFTWARHQMPEFLWTTPETAVEVGAGLLQGEVPD
jgi:tRNA dimethylallyltransferase